MVTNLHHMRDAWLNCRRYNIEEKLQVLNIMKSQKSLMYENMELELDSSERDESGEGLWSKRLKDRKHGLKMGHHSVYGQSPNLHFPTQRSLMFLEQVKFGKQNPKGTLKLAGSRTSSAKELVGHFPSVHHGVEMKLGPYGSPLLALTRQNKAAGYDVEAAVQIRDHMRGYDDTEETMYEVDVQRDWNFSQISALDQARVFKMGKKHEGLRGDEYTTDSFKGLFGSLKNDLHAYGSNRAMKKLSDIKVLTTKPSSARISYDYGKKVKCLENV
ncbi:hypothetical protein LOK49_LG05G01160 [Camellia lanceoleosa]|uniref:Uncharacterized protein n=1 Tax=Camellia lanceoleosa TaxID=1840588 RepID=A0ACC0HTC0_9ERIC|nr:hypothetical protein LOK49_LG05G01160 [Camellia lanceoleosa]